MARGKGRGRGRDVVESRKPTKPGNRGDSKRPRGLVQRWQVEDALAGFESVGDTISSRNHQRKLFVENFLRENTDTKDSDIELILSDLPSYVGWESDNKYRQV